MNRNTPIDLSAMKWTDNVRPVSSAVANEVAEAASAQRVALLKKHTPPRKRAVPAGRKPRQRAKEAAPVAANAEGRADR